MKILFVNQFFWPDSSATSQILTETATAFAAAGHDVAVLCAQGGYAASASANAPSVTIYRVPTFPFSRNKLGRLLSYASFCVGAMVRSLLVPRPEVTVTMTTPPLLSVLGMVMKTLRGCRHFIWEQDIYPDIAVDLKVIPAGGIVDRVVGAIADATRQHADGVVVLGTCSRQRLVNRGIEPDKIHVAHNWADSSSIHPLPRPGNLRELVLLYSGNFGLAHDADTLQQVMLRMRDDSRFRFIFVGGGTGREKLIGFCEANKITQAEMRSYVPRDQLSQGLAIGDIGLVTQHDWCWGSVVPSKVYGIMSSERPILFIGPKNSTPAYQIARHQCGWQIDPGDTEGLYALLIRLAADRGSVEAAGKRSRIALLEEYDKPLATKRLESIFCFDSQPGGAPVPFAERRNKPQVAGRS